MKINFYTLLNLMVLSAMGSNWLGPVGWSIQSFVKFVLSNLNWFFQSNKFWKKTVLFDLNLILQVKPVKGIMLTPLVFGFWFCVCLLFERLAGRRTHLNWIITEAVDFWPVLELWRSINDHCATSII